MKRHSRSLLRVLVLAACVGLLACTTTSAQYGPPRFDRQALESMLAPLALYPDPLLSQVLMAATYPREVDEAARWLRARAGLSGDAAVRTAEGWDWDPSVRSLLAFPLVLDTLASHPSWTQDLGEAFLVQQQDVMDAVQVLRRRAYDSGALRSNEHLRVVDTGYGIVIESASPQSVYVPYYDARSVYGSWWWPARPPMYWPRWPGYVEAPGHGHLHWGPGVHVAAGFFFGNFIWPRREVRIVTVHPYYYPRRVIVHRPPAPGRPAPIVEHHVPAPGVWQHDASRRHGDRERDRADRDRARASDRPPLAARSAVERAAPPAPPTPHAPRAADSAVRSPQTLPQPGGSASERRDARARERDETRSFERRERDGDGRPRRSSEPARAADRAAPAPGAAAQVGPRTAPQGESGAGRGGQGRSN